MTSLYRNASWGGASASVRLVFGMANFLLSVKLVGAASYGYLVVITAATAFYAALINSIHVIAVSKAAEFRSEPSSADKLHTLFSAVWIVTFLGAALLALAAAAWGGLFLQNVVYRGNDSQVATQLSATLTPVVFTALCQLIMAGHVAVIESLGRFDIAARAQLFGAPVVLAALTLCLIMQWHIEIAGVAWLLFASSVVDLTFVSYARFRSGYLSAFAPSRDAFRLLPELLTQGTSLQGAKLINVFFDPLNKFLLNHFVGSSSVPVYELAMKVLGGIQMIYGGAFKTFLQLAGRLRNDGSGDYIKAIRYGFGPAVLMYGFGTVLMVVLARFWFDENMSQLPLFFLLLIPPGLGIIFASPLYTALIGIRDLGFIFRMHLNLAVLNLAASLALIPTLGLYGAGMGLFATTGYNAYAEYRRYVEKIGPIDGLSRELTSRSYVIVLALSLAVTAVLVDRLIADALTVALIEGAITLALGILLMLEPMSLRVARQIKERVCGT